MTLLTGEQAEEMSERAIESGYFNILGFLKDSYKQDEEQKFGSFN